MISKHELIISDHEMAISEHRNGQVRARREILHATARIEELQKNILDSEAEIAKRLDMIRQANEAKEVVQ